MRPHCVFVSPTRPNPRGSGVQQRAFSWLTELARDSDVTLILALLPAAKDALEPNTLEQLQPYITRIEICPAATAPRMLRLAALLFPWLLLWRPELADDWLHALDWQPQLPATIDRIHVFRFRALPIGELIAKACGHRSYTLDLDDVESNTLASIARCVFHRGQRKFAFHLAAAALQYRILERTRLRQASCVYYSNPADLHTLRKRIPESLLRYKPKRITLPTTPPERRHSSVFSLLIVGTLDYLPNTDAALWIAEEIVPALRKTLGQDFEVVIVGRGASESLKLRLQQEPEIRFVGEVEQLAPCYAASHAALAPVRYGGGTKLKVLEAIAALCPVVATTHAAAGLPFAADRELLVADTPHGIAAACLQLKQNPAAADEMAHRANKALHTSGLVNA